MVLNLAIICGLLGYAAYIHTMNRLEGEEKRAQLVDEWMQVTGLSTKETRDLISKIEEGLEK